MPHLDHAMVPADGRLLQILPAIAADLPHIMQLIAGCIAAMERRKFIPAKPTEDSADFHCCKAVIQHAANTEKANKNPGIGERRYAWAELLFMIQGDVACPGCYTERPMTEQRAHKWLILVAVGSALLMGTIDGSIVNVALPSLTLTFIRSFTLSNGRFYRS